MADTIYDISFSNQTLYYTNPHTGQIGSAFASYSGGIHVDYTTGQAAGLVTVTPYAGNGSPYTISGNFTFTQTPSIAASSYGYQYEITGGASTYSNGASTFPSGGFSVIYNNQNPTAIGMGAETPGSTYTTGVSGGYTGTFLTSAASTPSSLVAGNLGFEIVDAATSTPGAGPVCFAAGTLIRTPRGEVSVERLRVGDLVVTASGAMRPIIWLGHRKIQCADYENPRLAWPIRVAAGAFGENRPSRDLYVSPAHSICVDCVGEVMIDAQRLVNGATITREEVAEIDYWHVELETHDVLLANNLPAESYLAMGNREFFVEREGVDRGSDFGEAEFCRPRGNDGPVLAAVRAQLEAQAVRLGYRAAIDPEPRLIVDGAEVACVGAPGAEVFLLPRTAKDVRLVSSTFVPCDDVGVNDDARRLGLCVYGLSLSDGRSATQMALNDQALADGFFPEEGADGCDWRWTRGETALPAALWQNFAGPQLVLHVAYEAKARRGWRAPAASAVRQEAPQPAPRLYAVN